MRLGRSTDPKLDLRDEGSIGAVELARTHRRAICVALHPGTVATALSLPFTTAGLIVQTPTEAASRLIAVIDRLTPDQTGLLLSTIGAIRSPSESGHARRGLSQRRSDTRAERAIGEPCLWDTDARVGACGDWCLGGRVDAAFDSGLAPVRRRRSSVV